MLPKFSSHPDYSIANPFLWPKKEAEETPDRLGYVSLLQVEGETCALLTFIQDI